MGETHAASTDRATMSSPRSEQEQAPAGPAQAAGLKRRAKSLPAARRPRYAVTAFVSPSAPSSPPRQPAAATVVEAADLVELVADALKLAKLAHDGIPQHGPAPEKCAARSDTAPGRPTIGRSDSGLSAAATECSGDSPIPPPQPLPPSKTPSAARGTASRNVPYRTLSRCRDRSLEQLHVAARLSAVRPARRQKLQSPID